MGAQCTMPYRLFKIYFLDHCEITQSNRTDQLMTEAQQIRSQEEFNRQDDAFRLKISY
jgi:hypothetical protein